MSRVVWGALALATLGACASRSPASIEVATIGSYAPNVLRGLVLVVRDASGSPPALDGLVLHATSERGSRSLAHCLASSDELRVCIESPEANRARLEQECASFRTEPGACPPRASASATLGTCALPSGLRWVYYEMDELTASDLEQMCSALHGVWDARGAAPI